MQKMLIMLESQDTRYEVYMQGIKRSNVDDTIVRWEARYNCFMRFPSGSSSASYGNRIALTTLEDFIEDLLLSGYEVVTYETKKFA